MNEQLNMLLFALIIFDFRLQLIGCSVKDFQPLSTQMIDYINSVSTTWKAQRNYFHDLPLSAFKKRLGVLTKPGNHVRSQVKIHAVDADKLPEQFDARTKWPFCESINEIRDQGECGSCWAFGAVETMTDRICIHSNGKVKAHLSSEDLITCCHFCGFGCNGGSPLVAWDYYRDQGLVTGGQYGSNKGCQPYKIPKCSHYESGRYPKCDEYLPAPKCQRSCIEGYTKPYEEDKHFGESRYEISPNASQIQAEIMRNGPVEAIYTIYADFVNYKSGVYRHVTGKELGSHAIKILGWGNEKGVPYWLVANSWNTDWGDKGFFKILRGKDECGIEGGIVAGLTGPQP